jgi:hypothetical protein
MNLSYLLIKPSNHIKQQFQTILSQSIDDLNIFIFDNDDTDIGWMLSTARQVDCIIIDIDNCDAITQKFVTFILAQPNTHYLTTDEITPYRLISKNRIYSLDEIVKRITEDEDNDNDAEED